MKSSELFQLLLDCSFISKGEYLERISQSLDKHTLTHIVTLNAEMIVEAQKNKEFREAIDKAELKIPDGSSMLWAREYLENRHTSRHPPRHSGLDPESTCLDPGSGAGMTASLIKFLFSRDQPLTGVDSIFDICEIVEKIGGSVCLLGGKSDEANGTAEILRKKYPELRVSLSRTSPNPSFERRGIRRRSLPLTKGELEGVSVLFVALGAPKQTLWIEQHRKTLEQASVKIAVGVGGAFAMIAGTLPRAPLILRRHHLEWLWRLVLEPKRIKRIWNAVVVFPFIIKTKKMYT